MTDDGHVLILILESDPYIQALQTAVLEPHGFRTVFAADGETALALARQLHPHLLIEDILVPKLDGLQVCRQLKDDPETRDIKVLIFTELMAERRAREAGADAYVRKPLATRQFLTIVQGMLGITASKKGGS
ncbi:MAG: response regulator [Chloroflexi bacterium]|nr:response regulator [Chloroflexota bacterium]